MGGVFVWCGFCCKVCFVFVGWWMEGCWWWGEVFWCLIWLSCWFIGMWVVFRFGYWSCWVLIVRWFVNIWCWWLLLVLSLVGSCWVLSSGWSWLVGGFLNDLVVWVLMWLLIVLYYDWIKDWLDVDVMVVMIV